MTTAAFDLGPVLVSDLPAASTTTTTPRAGLWARVREELVLRRENREFLRAVNSSSSPDEVGDLWAARRRS